MQGLSKKPQVAICLCGSIKIIVSRVNTCFTVCHCETCRRWGGGPFFAVRCGTDVAIENADKVSVFESSPWASRGFCSACGTHLYYQLNQTGEYNMPVGLFPDLQGLQMDMQYFSDQRPDYYCFSNITKKMTKAELESYFSD